MIVEPASLIGRHVRLEPLSLLHHAALCAVGLDGDIFRWFPEPVHSADDMRRFIEEALRVQQAGTALPFVTIEQATGKPIGSTRYGNIDRTHRRVEIGWTWIAPAWQRTPINTEAKYLMLCHAFEQLGCIRVELKTDSLNERSRAAILRIGAKEEGTLRNHRITASGRIRHTVYYSITDGEWPEVKATLQGKLRRA
jgi:RimJ/RimL family protein N-acetyltransferase